MSNYIDTHFHLDHYRNYKDIANQISELRQYTLCVTNSPEIFSICKETLCETNYLKFALGYHPQNKELCDRDFKDFLKLINRTNYVGEIGLDYSRNCYLDKNMQIKYFDQIVKICSETNKLMSIHIKSAEEDAIRILEKYKPKKAVIHWYTGNEKNLIRLIELGCYFSINSNMVASKNSSKYRIIPRDRLLIESDGPHTSINGKRYNPKLLSKTYDMISKFFNNPSMELDVYMNFKELLKK